MNRFVVLAVLGAFIATMEVGCTSGKKKVEPWSPQPLVRWDQVSTAPGAKPADSHRIDTTEPTQGLFPAALAICRVGPESNRDATQSARLVTDPRNEFLRWNSAFDDLMAVSEVFPIAQRTLGGGPAQIEQILASFQALHARLGLIYAVNELSENETEMLAVLYELPTKRALVHYHACLQSAPSPKKPDRDTRRLYLWDTDSRALVRLALEKQIHESLRQLIIHDKPAMLEDKSGWTPPSPPRPAEWPPPNPAQRSDHAKP